MPFVVTASHDQAGETSRYGAAEMTNLAARGRIRRWRRGAAQCLLSQRDGLGWVEMNTLQNVGQWATKRMVPLALVAAVVLLVGVILLDALPKQGPLIDGRRPVERCLIGGNRTIFSAAYPIENGGEHAVILKAVAVEQSSNLRDLRIVVVGPEKSRRTAVTSMRPIRFTPEHTVMGEVHGRTIDPGKDASVTNLQIAYAIERPEGGSDVDSYQGVIRWHVVDAVSSCQK